MEAAGIEPAVEIAANDNGLCTCEECQQCRAANALHFECFNRHFLTSFDADLQRVIAAWDVLDDRTRREMVASALAALKERDACLNRKAGSC